jgi:hypothetical protein
MLSRREAFSLFGLAAALGFALPAEMLTGSEAEAQAQTTAPAPSTPQTGTILGAHRRRVVSDTVRSGNQDRKSRW